MSKNFPDHKMRIVLKVPGLISSEIYLSLDFWGCLGIISMDVINDVIAVHLDDKW